MPIKKTGVSDHQIQIYVSYSRKNNDLVEEFLDHAKRLEAEFPVSFFRDESMHAGDEWDETLRRNLSESKIVLFFLSPDSLSSEYINKIEIPKALEMAKKDRIRVIPIILRDCIWDKSPLAKFRALPKNSVPVTKASSRSCSATITLSGRRQLS
ncbi:MAG: toll/interleukin-1 receptor domain-containing protein [Methylococcaceae bacterium]|jgi:hypothetical protein